MLHGSLSQFNKVEVVQREGESDEEFESRKKLAYDKQFLGPHAISQAVLLTATQQVA